MADYSGYTPQRQQKPQDPWADAAVGIAKLFMPDQESQIKARDRQQSEEYNAARLSDYKADAPNREAQRKYDLGRYEEANAQRGYHAEKGKIMAAAAATGKLTAQQAARLAELNSLSGGGSSSVSGLFGMTDAGKIAAAQAKAAKEKDAADKAEEKTRQDAEGEAKKASKETADRKSARFKGVYDEHGAPIDQIKLRNNIMNFWNSSPTARANNLLLTEASADQLAGFAAAQGYTNAELMTAAKMILYGDKDVKDTITAIPKFVGTEAYSEADLADLEKDHAARDWPAAKVKYQKMRKIGATDIVLLAEWAVRKPEVLRFAGTTEAIRDYVLRNPGQKIVFYDSQKEVFGGGVATSDSTVRKLYNQAKKPGDIAPDWEQANPYLLPWTEGDPGAPAGP